MGLCAVDPTVLVPIQGSTHRIRPLIDYDKFFKAERESQSETSDGCGFIGQGEPRAVQGDTGAEIRKNECGVCGPTVQRWEPTS